MCAFVCVWGGHYIYILLYYIRPILKNSLFPITHIAKVKVTRVAGKLQSCIQNPV